MAHRVQSFHLEKGKRRVSDFKAKSAPGDVAIMSVETPDPMHAQGMLGPKRHSMLNIRMMHTSRGFEQKSTLTPQKLALPEGFPRAALPGTS